MIVKMMNRGTSTLGWSTYSSWITSLTWTQYGRVADQPNEADQPGSSFLPRSTFWRSHQKMMISFQAEQADHPRVDAPFIHMDDSACLLFYIKRWTCVDTIYNNPKLISWGWSTKLNKLIMLSVDGLQRCECNCEDEECNYNIDEYNCKHDECDCNGNECDS